MAANFSTNTQNAVKKNSPHLIEKAWGAIFGLNLHIKESVWYYPPDLAIKMYDKQIRPVLDYVCDIYYTGKEDYEMEKVYLGYLKYLLHVKPSSGTAAIYAECGTFPTYDQIRQI